MKKWKIIVPILILAVLAFAFWYGGDAPSSQGWEVEKTEPQTPTPPPETPIIVSPPEADKEVAPAPQEEAPIVEDDATIVPQDSQEPPVEDVAPILPEAPTTESEESTPSLEEESSQEPTPESEADTPPVESYEEPEEPISPEIEAEKPQADPAPTENPLPVNPEDVTISDNLLSCTMSIRCDTILNHMDWLVPGKESLVPLDGIIYGAQTVPFYEGESVFNILLRETKKNKIHMEYENTPLYNAAYIQGIHNLYEFDVGELSGWMYKVNGWFPNYGCSRYVLQDGDVIEWVYSCDLGQDVGGNNAMN